MSLNLIDFKKQIEELKKLPYEVLAHALYSKGEDEGYSKITDKTKWREPVMAEKLGHTAHKKISAGAGKDEYGSDAKDKNDGYAEYKSFCITEKGDKSVDRLMEKIKYKKSGKTFSPLKVCGIYNGYNAKFETASVEYAKVDHYFGVFAKELCVLIIKVNTDYVMKKLNENYDDWVKKGSPGSTNLNKVFVNLGDTDLYKVSYKNETWWEKNK